MNLEKKDSVGPEWDLCPSPLQKIGDHRPCNGGKQGTETCSRWQLPRTCPPLPGVAALVPAVLPNLSKMKCGLGVTFQLEGSPTNCQMRIVF